MKYILDTEGYVIGSEPNPPDLTAAALPPPIQPTDFTPGAPRIDTGSRQTGTK